MKVTFDSNVWRKIASPTKFPNDPSIEAYKKIRLSIEEGKLTAFLCETIFSLEAIQSSQRRKYISSKGQNYHVKLDFTNNPVLKKHFDDACEIGFKIIRLSRMGGFINDDVEPIRFKLENEEFQKFHNSGSSIAKTIEKYKAGISWLKDIGLKYDSNNWISGIINSPSIEEKSISKAVAEWADGDSVATSIALECDYLCTLDEAKGAGSTSIFSQVNLEWLKNDYGFKIISPDDLAIKI